MHKTPSTDQFDPGYRRLRYVRYADDFIIGVTGTREEAEFVMLNVREYIAKTLFLEVAEDKTCIRKAKTGVRFLGYDIRTYTGSKTMKVKSGKGTCIKRTIADRIQLHVPAEKVLQYASKKGYGDMALFRPTSRSGLLQRSDVEILLTYNAEMSGIANYYALAHGYKTSLSKLIGLAQLSLFATLSHKHQSTMAKIAKQMNVPNRPGYELRVANNGIQKSYRLFRLSDHKPPRTVSTEIDLPWSTTRFTISRTELIQRVNANKCEYCGKTGGYMEVHHIKALKDILKKKQLWQRMMSVMNRKTMILCVDCHKELHSRGLPDWRAKARRHP
jgi:RNA-directed DNA polymerase